MRFLLCHNMSQQNYSQAIIMLTIFYLNKEKMSVFGKDSRLVVGHTEHLLMITIDFIKCCN